MIHAGNRNFAGANEEGIVILDGVDLVASLGELSVANEAEITGHRWHDQRREAFLRDAVKGEIHQRQFQASGIIFEDVAACARDLDGAFDIHHIQCLHDGVVVAWLKVEMWQFAPVFDGYVVVLIFADGCAGVGNIGHEVEQLLTLFDAARSVVAPCS